MSRRKLREQAFIFLFESTFGLQSLNEIITNAELVRDEKTDSFTRELFEGTLEKQDLLDEYIEKNFGRSLSPIEYEKINSWLSLYQQEIIEYAINIAVLNNKRTFNYVEGILKTWKGKNLESLNQIQEDQRQFESVKYSHTDTKKELFDYDWLNDPDGELEGEQYEKIK